MHHIHSQRSMMWIKFLRFESLLLRIESWISIVEIFPTSVSSSRCNFRWKSYMREWDWYSWLSPICFSIPIIVNLSSRCQKCIQIPTDHTYYTTHPHRNLTGISILCLIEGRDHWLFCFCIPTQKKTRWTVGSEYTSRSEKVERKALHQQREVIAA